MKQYVDERGRTFAEDELENEYYQLRMEQETDCEKFADYIKECTGKNGTLTCITG